MIVKSAEFVTSATAPMHYPDPLMPEIAFAGRSNVGKSSMINTLVNRKRLVKTSNTPGRTQLINFFNINGEFLLVDLPGYGYARVPRAVQKHWAPMIETYLSSRSVLAGVVLILDIRRIPAEEELNFIHWLTHYRRRYLLVATKTDKLSKSKQNQQRVSIASAMGVAPEAIRLFSAKTRFGKPALWQALSEWLKPAQEDANRLEERR